MATATRRAKVTPDSVALDDLAETIKELRKIKDRQRKIEIERERLEKALKSALGDSPKGTLNGEDVILWSKTVRTNVSVPLLKEKYPDVAEACSTSIEVRTFKLLDVL